MNATEFDALMSTLVRRYQAKNYAGCIETCEGGLRRPDLEAAQAGWLFDYRHRSWFAAGDPRGFRSALAALRTPGVRFAMSTKNLLWVYSSAMEMAAALKSADELRFLAARYIALNTKEASGASWLDNAARVHLNAAGFFDGLELPYEADVHRGKLLALLARDGIPSGVQIPSDARAFVDSVSGASRTAPLTVRRLDSLLALFELGFRGIGYCAFAVRRDGTYFWIEKDHMRAIFDALPASLDRLHLEYTCLAPGSDEVVPTKGHVDALVFAHAAGDEVTVNEARWIARCVARLETRSLTLWSPGFEARSLDTLVNELRAAGCPSLKAYEICDTRLPNGKDSVTLPALDALIRGGVRS